MIQLWSNYKFHFFSLCQRIIWNGCIQKWRITRRKCNCVFFMLSLALLDFGGWRGEGGGVSGPPLLTHEPFVYIFKMLKLMKLLLYGSHGKHSITKCFFCQLLRKSYKKSFIGMGVPDFNAQFPRNLKGHFPQFSMSGKNTLHFTIMTQITPSDLKIEPENWKETVF